MSNTFGLTPHSCCRIAQKMGGIKCPICYRDVTRDVMGLSVVVTVRPDGIYVHNQWKHGTRALWASYGRTWADLFSRYAFPADTHVFIR